MELRIAVKELASTIYKSGDLTPEFFFNHTDQDGKKIHKEHQRKYNKESKAEYYLEIEDKIDDYDIYMTGYIDGLLIENTETIIEEIKSTPLNLDKIDETYHEEYLAQLKLYCYMYTKNNSLEEIKARLLYINIDTKEEKDLPFVFTFKELETFYKDSILKYLEWEKIIDDNYQKASTSIEKLRFPYKDFRKGQKELMKAIFISIKSGETLYAVAPTGIGKTISAIYPALKSLQEREEKVFYLTAKSTQKKLAIDTVDNMIKNGLDIRILEITAKEEICPLKTEICDPENCPYAKEYFKKLKDAIKDALNEKVVTKEKVTYYGEKHKLCPFEFSLSLSEFCNMIVCDYNYVFDPIVKLHSYFDFGTNAKNILLIDEAHNMVDRSRSMYSAELSTITLNNLKKLLKPFKPSQTRRINKIIKRLNEFDEKLVDNILVLDKLDNQLLLDLSGLKDKIEEIIGLNRENKNRKRILKNYLELNMFLKISAFFTDSSRFIIEKSESEYQMKITCLDASKFIHADMNQAEGKILFSATLTPLEYYQALLTEGEGNYIILPSPFPKKNFKLIFNDKIKTYYSYRNDSIDKVINLIEISLKNKPGNHIIFFPSYQYLNMVKEKLMERENDFEIVVQSENLTKDERASLISKFDNTDSKLGMFVLGGVFSEGIDLLGDKLSGVIIVGVGIPQINYQNELLKNYYDVKFEKGFDYAYTYPGFNKVMQAVGRLIRSETDRGACLIIDPRITRTLYLEMLPSAWKGFKVINNQFIYNKELSDFWQEK